jgi:hypothetical protein
MKDWSQFKKFGSVKDFSSRWKRNDNDSKAEIARSLYEEIQSLIQDIQVFQGNYGLVVNHYRKLAYDVVA